MIPAAIVGLILLVLGARSVHVIPSDSAYVVERLGKFDRILSSGLHVLIPVLDRIAFRFSLLPKNEKLSDACITLDNVPIRITSAFRWQVIDPERAAYAFANVMDFVTEIVRTAQREWVSRTSWDDVRETTREFAQHVLRSTAEAATGAGVKLVGFEIERIERVTS